MTIENRELLGSRWKIADSVFLEYQKGTGVFLEVGPFPEDPNDRQLDEAIEHLQTLNFPFLNLEPYQWALDLGKLGDSIPELQRENLSGLLIHPPAFAVSAMFNPIRVLGRYASEQSTACYLRIDFEFGASSAELPPADWQPPQIIS